MFSKFKPFTLEFWNNSILFSLGSVHSMKLTFVQNSSGDEDDDDDNEPEGKKETQSQEKLEKGQLEESEETHL